MELTSIDNDFYTEQTSVNIEILLKFLLIYVIFSY